MKVFRDKADISKTSYTVISLIVKDNYSANNAKIKRIMGIYLRVKEKGIKL